MRKFIFFFLLSHLFAAGSLHAEISDTSAYGFTAKQVVIIPSKSTDSVFRQLVDIGKWWDPEHTWSGDAANLSITLSQNGGCFCEKLKNGGVVRHLSVIYNDPGKLLRFNGGLGPLQEMPVNGVLTFTLTQQPEGVRVEMVYSVSGFTKVRLSKIAPLVDMVMGLQMKRFQEFGKR